MVIFARQYYFVEISRPLNIRFRMSSRAFLTFTEFEGEKRTNCDTGHLGHIRPQMYFLEINILVVFVTHQGSAKVSIRKILKKTKQNFIL